MPARKRIPGSSTLIYYRQIECRVSEPYQLRIVVIGWHHCCSFPFQFVSVKLKWKNMRYSPAVLVIYLCLTLEIFVMLVNLMFIVGFSLLRYILYVCLEQGYNEIAALSYEICSSSKESCRTAPSLPG